MKQTYYGDGDLGGTVDFNDFLLWDFGFNNNPTGGWENGDYDFSGQVDFNDFLLWDFSFNNQDVVLAAHGGPVAVPEPSSLALLAAGVGMAWCCRRYRGKRLG